MTRRNRRASGIVDLNWDEYPDYYISNIVTLAKDEKYVLPTADTPMAFAAENLATMRIVEMNHLFVSVTREGGLARYVLSDAVKRGATSTGWAWDADFFDFDNDGDLRRQRSIEAGELRRVFDHLHRDPI